MIEAAQKGNAHSYIGQAIVEEGFTETMAKEYVSADGYGAHFNSYDGSEEELTINGVEYYAFDTH